MTHPHDHIDEIAHPQVTPTLVTDLEPLTEVDCRLCGEPTFANAPHSPKCPIGLELEPPW